MGRESGAGGRAGQPHDGSNGVVPGWGPGRCQSVPAAPRASALQGGRPHPNAGERGGRARPPG
eukprot:8249640-Lingulodinium_polyedra.AAC.1